MGVEGGDKCSLARGVPPVMTHEIEIGGKRTFTVEAGVQFGLNDTTPDTAAKVQVTVGY